MTEYSGYVRLDVHKDTIAVGVAVPGREDPVYRGEIRNTRRSLKRLIGRQNGNRRKNQLFLSKARNVMVCGLPRLGTEAAAAGRPTANLAVLIPRRALPSCSILRVSRSLGALAARKVAGMILSGASKALCASNSAGASSEANRCVECIFPTRAPDRRSFLSRPALRRKRRLRTPPSIVEAMG